MKAKKSKSILPMILIAAGVLLLIVMAVLLVGQINNNDASLTSTSPATENIPYPDIQRVTLSESFKAYEEGSAVFVDVRSAESYQQEHIPGSINIPSDQVAAEFKSLDPNKWIITYCT